MLAMDNEPALQGVSMMYLEIEWNVNVVMCTVFWQNVTQTPDAQPQVLLPDVI